MDDVTEPVVAQEGGTRAPLEGALPTAELSPLLEAEIDSLDQLFDRFDNSDIGYRDRDLDTIVAAVRRQRVRWDEAERLGLRRVPKAKIQAEPLDLSRPLSIGDLGL